MCTLNSLTRQCGTRNTPGTGGVLYFAPLSEIIGWPQTRADLLGVAAQPGDSKILDEPFAWVPDSGLGYWRQAPILVNTGNLRNTGEGEIGGIMNKTRITGFIQGDGPEVQEFVDCMSANSGCMVMAIRTKDGDLHVVGDRENPVFLEPYEGDRETRAGYLLTFMADTGVTSMIYDDATHGLKTTPNA